MRCGSSLPLQVLCCWSRAPTLPICSSFVRRRDSARSPFGGHSGRVAERSPATSSRKACCWRRSAVRSVSRSPGACLLYTSDAADERSSVDLGGRRIIKKKKNKKFFFFFYFLYI